jgi:hypothetical protein
MALITELVVDATTGEQTYVEVERELPNPRIGEIERRLQEIRAELQSTDYKAIKFAEGAYTEAEYASTKSQRTALRAEYNELEAELATL